MGEPAPLLILLVYNHLQLFGKTVIRARAREKPPTVQINVAEHKTLRA
jgi:hypothetical protein